MKDLNAHKIKFLTEATINLQSNTLNDHLLAKMAKELKGERFSFDDCAQLMKQVLRLKNMANTDVTITRLLRSRPAFNMPSGAELDKYLDMYEMLHESQPVALSKATIEIYDLISSSKQLSKQNKVTLEQLVRLAALLNPNLHSPILCFSEILESQETFSKNVSEANLVRLVDAVLKRL
jgi:hypothetical protein